jgi:hypothetical protein
MVFSGIQLNMWTCSKERRFITHRLCSRVKDDVPCGYQALDSESILHGNAGELGDYSELALLPDKIAGFLYEYHSESYSSLQPELPQLPDDRSNFNVHGMLTPHQIDLHTIHTQYLLDMLLTVYLYLTEQIPNGHSSDTSNICYVKIIS